jgi:copper chaperone CopZ
LNDTAGIRASLAAAGETMKHIFQVKGMHCKSCAALITEALEDEGIKKVNIKLDEKKQIGTVSLESDLPKEALIAIIEDQGDYTAL